jgi:hypothetical protein
MIAFSNACVDEDVGGGVAGAEEGFAGYSFWDAAVLVEGE